MVDRAARWQVLFGDAGGPGPGWDDLDEGERLVLVEEVFGLTGAQGATQVVLLAQLLDGEPPFVWETLERLLDAGVGLDGALGQLRMVLLSTMHDVIAGDEYDDDEYRRRLAGLPLPDAGLVEDVLDRMAAERRVAATDELIDAVVVELGREPGDRMLQNLVERVMEELIMEGFGPLQWLSGGRTVHRRALTRGIVLTHELTDHERSVERMEVDVDLAGFVGLVDPSLADADENDEDDEILMLTDGQWSMSWLGPDGWLDPYPAGSVLAVRVDDEEMVSIEVLADPPAVDPAVVGLLRRVVEEEVDEPGMPVTAADVILGMLAEQPDVFDRPQAPLRQLCHEAGLEMRDTEIGDDPELWRSAAQLRRYGRLHERTDDDRELVAAVVGVLDVCERLVVGEDIDPDDIETALEALADLDVLDLVSEELFRDDVDPAPTPEVFATLAGTATGPSLASVHTLAAIGAEHDGEPAVAEQHLELAVEADPTHVFALDRLAWYASDRGDAPKAVRLWSQLTGPSIEQAVVELRPFTRARTGRGTGRNQPCWCGSGRKFKHCHLGEPELVPLPDRVGWLCRKAIQYLERQGREGWATTYDIAIVLADHDPERLAEVFEDPVVLDLALTEGGWFEEFLADRGPLLPEDEALLAASWVTVDRTVYEVEDVAPGEGVTVRDLRSGELLAVRERAFSREAQPGMLVCARAVPDGETHQFIGAVLSVPVGQEAHVLDLLDDGDPAGIAGWVASRSRPPQLRTREGEEVVQCELVVETDDAEGLRRHLDETYQVDEPGEAWSEHHDLDGDEAVIRATLHLDNDGRLVISTNSHERADRILDRLPAALSVTIVADTRTPIDLSGGLPGSGERSPGLPDLRRLRGLDDDLAMGDVAEQIADQLERRWCAEAVPALGGLTPRDAAADPTRREQLIRLIASFEHQPTPEGAIAMRPHRLRALLGL